MLLKIIKIFLKKEKSKKNRLYVCERFKNLSEDEKQKLAEYRRNYYIMLYNITKNI